MNCSITAAAFLLLSSSCTTAFAPVGLQQLRHDTLLLHESSVDDMSSSTIRSKPAPQLEIDRRRNLAIISHPDSGKTTMTEKLLLYGGAIQQAGAVRQKAEQRATASDFMEMEKERGISISSTVMNFDYHDLRVNILGELEFRCFHFWSFWVPMELPT